jgi:hypothetical protein
MPLGVGEFSQRRKQRHRAVLEVSRQSAVIVCRTRAAFATPKMKISH